ncbi:MAG TPA: hypothetical protein VMY41_17180 [Thermohalobaculum sp.]|nr:hypothetical protein [Thermohalobaculum sp.]
MWRAAGINQTILIAVTMIGLAGLELGYLIGGIEVAGLLGRGAALLVIVVIARQFGFREWLLLGLACALTLGLAGTDEGFGSVRYALDQGAFFAAFILLMTLLREAAVTSPAVLALGHFLTSQQPGRRFVATYVGGHLSGVLLNFGAISLLAPLVQRGVRAEPVVTPEDERRAAIRAQRQLSALIRGFAVVITWAPTTLTQAIILHALPGLHAGRVMAMGVVVSGVFLLVGWTEDRLRWGRPRRRAPGPPVVRFPLVAARDLGLVALCLVIGTYGARAALGTTTAQALMLMAPMMLVGWVFTQNAGSGAGQGALAVRRRLGEVIAGPLPRMTRDAYLLGVAGFIGAASARLAPVDAIAAHLALESMPAWLFLSALPVIIMASGNIAMAPIMVVVFLAAVISALPVLPADPDLIAVSLGAGWALSMTASPNATGPILLAGITGLPTTTLTWRWNGVYSVAALGVLCVGFYLVG